MHRLRKKSAAHVTLSVGRFQQSQPEEAESEASAADQGRMIMIVLA
jgi:hypothetical protein